MTEVADAYRLRARTTEEQTGEGTISEEIRKGRIDTDGDARS
jgi:hypothetical protein